MCLNKSTCNNPSTVGCVLIDKSDILLALLKNSIAVLSKTDGVFTELIKFKDAPAKNRFNDGFVAADARIWAGSLDYDCKLPLEISTNLILIKYFYF